MILESYSLLVLIALALGIGLFIRNKRRKDLKPNSVEGVSDKKGHYDIDGVSLNKGEVQVSGDAQSPSRPDAKINDDQNDGVVNNILETGDQTKKS